MSKRFLIIQWCVLLLLISTSSFAAENDVPKSLQLIASALTDSTQLSNKVVYVDFWASWCTPCRKSFPWMKGLQDSYQSLGLQVVAVNLDKDHRAAQAFLTEMKAPLAVIFDSTGSLAKSYHLQAMPMSFLYGRDGNLRTSHEGFLPKDTLDLSAQIRKLLAESVSK
jgi:cytochrome c biogenesis protein CcmG, thiol:disulfide interchange protein DsbE